MATKHRKVGDVVYQAEGEWNSGRPIDDFGTVRDTQEEAVSDVANELGRFTGAEIGRIRGCWVRAYTVTAVDDSASDGIGSMESVGRGVPVPF